MERVVDDHCFTITLPHTAGPHCCRVQVFEGGNRNPIVLATQDLPPATGRSLTNAAEQFAEEVWRRHLPEHAEPPRWIQHYTSGPGDWLEVRFEIAPSGRLASPRWVAIDPDDLAVTIGRPLDPDRGADYAAPRPDPVRPFVLRTVSVASLPPTHPFRTTGCMPRTGTTRHRLLRRLMPVRSRNCCWYHGGDWREVAQLIQEAIAPSHEIVVHHEDRWQVAQRVESFAPADSWLRDAAASLIVDPLGVDGSGWINGQHRGQAAIDSGARWILIERY